MSDLAAALLKDVPRFYNTSDTLMTEDPMGAYVHWHDLMDALSRALDPALAERAGEVLEGVTPGPWRTHAVDDTAIISSDGTDVGTTCDSAKAERDDAYNNNYEQMEADARFIAWCREGVPALLAQNAALRAEVRESAMDAVSAGCQAQEAWEAQKAAEAQIAALTARVERLTGALRKAEQNFYEAANRFQDEDYEGPHEKFTVNVVCHIKPYFDMHIKHLRDSAAAARAALATEEGHD